MDLMMAAPVAGLSALAFAAYLTWSILRRETGPAHMREVSDAFRAHALKGEN